MHWGFWPRSEGKWTKVSNGTVKPLTDANRDLKAPIAGRPMECYGPLDMDVHISVYANQGFSTRGFKVGIVVDTWPFESGICF